MGNEVEIDLATGLMTGNRIRCVEKRLNEMRGVFHDEIAFDAMAQDLVIYRVQLFTPVGDGTEGGLFWGNTVIEPGKVGNEYFMTKGHFHSVRNRAEYYATVLGRGALILMDERGATRFEAMTPGSLHYIPANTAHRVANVGDTALNFMACWPSDAGHDYETIEREGFGVRLIERDGKPELVGK